MLIYPNPTGTPTKPLGISRDTRWCEVKIMCQKQKEIIDPLKIICCAPKESLISDDTVICRYFNGDKYKKLLNDQAIWFSNITNFSDMNERKIPESYFYKWQNGVETYKKIYEMKKEYISSYVSCWTIGPSENYALWRLYDSNSDGCMIQTTIGKLRKQLEKECPESIIFDMVKYIVPEKDKTNKCPMVFFDTNTPPFCILHTEIYKIFPYKYEEEIRAVFYTKKNEEVSGYNIPINLSELIDYVYISPFSKEEIREQIRDNFSKVVQNEKIKDSIIHER